jgi:hypothetical protein
MSEITRQGKVAYGTNSSYVVWRNVLDYGAKGQSCSAHRHWNPSNRLQAMESPMIVMLSTMQHMTATDVPTLAIHKLPPQP